MVPSGGLSPRRVMVAGDWHGNARWAEQVIRTAGDLLRDEETPLIVHCGDFGIWPGKAGSAYTDAVERACKQYGVRIWFVDGNHEDFTRVARFDPGRLASRRITHLPRGYRWEWHGRTWLALGGAASVDRALRIEGESWWPQEEVTGQQAADAAAAGPADVMVTHDCPSGVVHSFPPPPRFWDPRDLARSDRHRERLQLVVNAVQPGWLVHGHLHRAYQRTCDFGYGAVEVTGLDCDGGDGANWAVLDVRLMQWEESQRVTVA